MTRRGCWWRGCCAVLLGLVGSNSFQLLPLNRGGLSVRDKLAATAYALEADVADILVSSLNRDLEPDLQRLALLRSSLSEEAERRNAISRGSLDVTEAKVTAVSCTGLSMQVKVSRKNFWGKVESTLEKVSVEFSRRANSIDDCKTQLMALCRSVGRFESSTVIYSIPVGSYSELPEGLRLNNVPHSPLARNFVYNGAASAVLAAVADPGCSRRMVLRCTIPELNPEMDTYRVGTMLELVREIALSLAETGNNVKLCVQGSMGEGIFTGLPLSLSGTRVIMERMDWGDSGYVGEDESPIRFGQVGPQFVEDRDNVFIVIAPQSIVGATIHDSLSAMTEEALRSGKTVILVNPNLNDKPSSAGLMGVRGRAERMEFASSFQDIYNFRLIYPNQAVMFPILGAVMKRSYDAPYVVFKLRSDAHYEVAGAFDSDPGTEDLSKLKI